MGGFWIVKNQCLLFRSHGGGRISSQALHEPGTFAKHICIIHEAYHQELEKHNEKTPNKTKTRTLSYTYSHFIFSHASAKQKKTKQSLHQPSNGKKRENRVL